MLLEDIPEDSFRGDKNKWPPRSYKVFQQKIFTPNIRRATPLVGEVTPQEGIPLENLNPGVSRSKF